MIVGIGTDIIRIQRMNDALSRHGDRIVERILTPEEQALFAQRADPARFLAKRWAAKEAAAKALGTGIRGSIGFHSFSIRHDDLGKPELLCLTGAAERLAELGGRQSWLTLSDEADYAVAFVVLSA